MKPFDLHKITRAVILFSNKAKFNKPITAKTLYLNGRQTHLLKIVLTHKFFKSEGAPIDFPKMFICDNPKKGLFHLNSTPNDVDLSILTTVSDICKLMSYVSRREKCSKNEKQEDETRLDFSRPHTMKVLRTAKNGDVVVVFHFI